MAWATRRARHGARPGRGPVLGAGPVAWEAVLQLQRVPDQRLPTVGGHAQGQRELGDRELTHQRCTLPGQDQLGVGTRDRPGCGDVDGLGWVLLGPGDRGQQDVGLGAVSGRAGVPGELEHRGSGVQVGPGAGHGSIQAGTTDSFRGEFRLVGKGFEGLLWCLLLIHEGCRDERSDPDSAAATPTVEPSDRDPAVGVGEHPGDPPPTDTTLIENRRPTIGPMVLDRLDRRRGAGPGASPRAVDVRRG